MRNQIREVELTDADRLYSFAKVKWLGVGDKLYAMIFALLKAKLQHETMHILLRDDDTIIEDKEGIL